MADNPDRLSLQQFVEQVSTQFLDAAAAIEQAHPDWRIGAVEITARVAFKQGPVGQVLVDLDEPDRLMSELHIPLQRKWDAE